MVDDDNTYTFSAKRILKDSPVFEDYIIFNSPFNALEHFKKVASNPSEIPDVLFLDINMPVMDGWDFLNEFSKIKASLSKAVTIYIISSSIDPIDVERAKSMSDVAQYIIKPIDIEQFEKIFKYFDVDAA